MSAEAFPSTPSNIPSFDVHPYQPDGGYSSLGSALCIVMALIAAAIMGFVTSWIGQHFYLIILFPIGVGVVVGFTLNLAIRLGKVRSPWLGGVAGLMGGALSTVMMLFFDYQRQLSQVAQVDPQVWDRVELFEKLGMDKQKPRDMEQAEWNEWKLLIKVRKVDTFLKYIDYAAEEGVSIGRGSSKGFNLGYYGTLIYYGVEMLIIGFVAFAIGRSAAAEPYCTACNQWKVSKQLSDFVIRADRVNEWLDAIRLGTPLPRKDFDVFNAEGARYVTTLYRCPACGNSNPVDVKVEEVTIGNKGQEQKAEKVFVTYPGEAEPVLEALMEEPTVVEPDAPPPPPPPAASAEQVE